MCQLHWTQSRLGPWQTSFARRGLPQLRDRPGVVGRDGLQPQSNAKESKGRQYEDRDAQFVHLNGDVEWHLAVGQPMISVDARIGSHGDTSTTKGWETSVPKGQPRSWIANRKHLEAIVTEMEELSARAGKILLRQVKGG